MTIRPRDLVALVVVGLVAVVGAFYMLALKPERQRATSLTGQIATARESLATEIAKFQTGRTAKGTLAAENARWSALERALPQSSDIPALLRLLQRDAQSVGVQMQSIQLQSSTAATTTPTPTTPTTPTTPGTTSTAVATSVPLTMTFAGDYKGLDRLVRKLDQMVVLSGDKVTATGPLLTISGVQISGAKPLTVQLTATIYQLSATSSTGTATGGQS